MIRGGKLLEIATLHPGLVCLYYLFAVFLQIFATFACLISDFGTFDSFVLFCKYKMLAAQRLQVAQAKPFAGSALQAPRSSAIRRPFRPFVTRAAASDDVGAAGTAAIALGLLANPIALWSEYTLATTGAGLPPGPGGALGAAEGISYLVVLGIVGWSAYTKVQTGSGLPAGPSGLLGAAEGFSYLSLLGGIIAFAVKSLS